MSFNSLRRLGTALSECLHKWGTLAAIVAAAYGGLKYAGIAKDQLVETIANNKESANRIRESLKLSQRQLEASDRAWLKPTITISVPLTWSPAGAHFEINVAWNNVGRTIARRVGSSSRIISPPRLGPVRVEHETQEECRMAEIMPMSKYPVGGVVWPGEVGSGLRFQATIPRAEIFNGVLWSHTPGWPGEYWEPSFVGCAAYLVANSTNPHYTTFAYNIERVLPSHHPGITLIEIGKDVPARDLVLSQNDFEGNGAN